MTPQEIQSLLESKLAGCEIKVGGDGYHHEIIVIGDAFEGLNAVKRQQFVYAALKEKIADGTIHAVIIKTYTPAQWAEKP